MFLTPTSPLHYQGFKFATLFSQPVQSNPSKFFPAFEAPADTLLGARADAELAGKIEDDLEAELSVANREWQAASGPKRSTYRHYACKTLRDYREARNRANATRSTLFRMLKATARREMAA